MMEEHFQRAMLLSRGDFSTFVTRPISGVLLAVTAGIFLWSIYGSYRRRVFERTNSTWNANNS
jgi:TctA family transporter